MRILKNRISAFLFSSFLSGCYIQGYIEEDDYNNDDTLTIDVLVQDNRLLMNMPCRMAGVRFERDEYAIKCNADNFFIHNSHTDYLQFGNVSYWDYDQNGAVDRMTVNGVSLNVNDYFINNFYRNKLSEFRKDYVEHLWADWLSRHPQ